MASDEPRAQRTYDETFLLEELKYRRDKGWKIFSWTATILTAIAGAVIAAEIGTEPDLRFAIGFRCIASVAVLGLGFFAYTWIDHNWKSEIAAREAYARYCDSVGKKSHLEGREAFYGYTYALVLLGAVAIAALWLKILLPSMF